jgi:hypothetical protein
MDSGRERFILIYSISELFTSASVLLLGDHRQSHSGDLVVLLSKRGCRLVTHFPVRAACAKHPRHIVVDTFDIALVESERGANYNNLDDFQYIVTTS